MQIQPQINTPQFSGALKKSKRSLAHTAISLLAIAGGIGLELSGENDERRADASALITENR